MYRRKYRKNFLVTYYYLSEYETQGYGQEQVVVTNYSLKTCLIDVDMFREELMERKDLKNAVITSISEVLK